MPYRIAMEGKGIRKGTDTVKGRRYEKERHNGMCLTTYFIGYLLGTIHNGRLP